MTDKLLLTQQILYDDTALSFFQHSSSDSQPLHGK